MKFRKAAPKGGRDCESACGCVENDLQRDRA